MSKPVSMKLLHGFGSAILTGIGYKKKQLNTMQKKLQRSITNIWLLKQGKQKDYKTNLLKPNKYEPLGNGL